MDIRRREKRLSSHRIAPGWLPIVVVVVALFSACNGDGNHASTSTSSSSSGDPVLKPPPGACVQPGDMGNEIGVGTPCTPNGKECIYLKPKPLSCTADFGQDEWFCTVAFCKSDDQCGTDAFCHMTGIGSGCVLKRCFSDGAGGMGGSGGSGGAGGMGGAGSGSAGAGGVGGSGGGN
jgi:hypothetical protein